MYLTSVIAKINVLTFCAIEVMLCDCFFIIIIITYRGLLPLFSDCSEMG